MTKKFLDALKALKPTTIEAVREAFKHKRFYANLRIKVIHHDLGQGEIEMNRNVTEDQWIRIKNILKE